MIALSSDSDEAVRSAANATLNGMDAITLWNLASHAGANPELLGFICLWPRSPRELIESVVFNPSTPDAALAQLAVQTRDPKIIEVISVKQQSLIRCPQIIEAILANDARSFEAERRAREVREEFFEKEFGAQMVADEQRVRGEAEREAAAEAAQATVSISGIEDLIRLGLLEEGEGIIDDRLIAEFEEEYGPLDATPPAPSEHFDLEGMMDSFADEGTELSVDRIPVFQRVALMSIKEKVMLAIKGTREARMILVRDPNRVIAGAVLKNPRLTDSEVEAIASFKSVPEDVLRQIGQSRTWSRSYIVIHNLVRNPRTPIATSLGFINRIQLRDLRGLAQNKNVPDVVRQSANRLYLKRAGN